MNEAKQLYTNLLDFFYYFTLDNPVNIIFLEKNLNIFLKVSVKGFSIRKLFEPFIKQNLLKCNFLEFLFENFSLILTEEGNLFIKTEILTILHDFLALTPLDLKSKFSQQILNFILKIDFVAEYLSINDIFQFVRKKQELIKRDDDIQLQSFVSMLILIAEIGSMDNFRAKQLRKMIPHEIIKGIIIDDNISYSLKSPYIVFKRKLKAFLNILLLR